MCILIAKIRNLSEVTTISLYFYGFFEKKLQKVLEIQEKVVPLHPQSRKRQLDAKELGYGVMVTLQILVLPFLVRVRVPQPKDGCAKAHPFFVISYSLAKAQPSSKAIQSSPSAPHSWTHIAAPNFIQRDGLSEGMPKGSSGPMPVNLHTFSMYRFVLFSFGGAQRLIIALMV